MYTLRLICTNKSKMVKLVKTHEVVYDTTIGNLIYMMKILVMEYYKQSATPEATNMYQVRNCKQIITQGSQQTWYHSYQSQEYICVYLYSTLP